MSLLLAALLPSPAAAITREEALDRASRYAVHVWTMTEDNAEISCASGWESDYTPGTWVGLPYDWGGYVTLDEFDQQLADGYGAGSHSEHGSLWCTTGVDCSGYVSKVWDTGHYSTSTFHQVTHDIGWDELLRADAVNDAGSHIVLFTHVGEDGWPVFYEASGGGEKVRLNSGSGWGYLDGYQPVRFDDIEDGGSTGTATDPKVITAFPYTDSWWTPGAASDSLDAYSCQPDADEGGPEVLYRFDAPTGGRLVARVSDADGVDIDVHVLTAPRADACLARDDTEVAVDVPAGEVWLSLDSYVGSHEYPGPYVLSVDFTPAEAPDEGGDTGSVDSGDPDDTGEEAPGAATPHALVQRGGKKGCATTDGGGAGGLLLGLALLLGRRAAAPAPR